MFAQLLINIFLPVIAMQSDVTAQSVPPTTTVSAYTVEVFEDQSVKLTLAGTEDTTLNWCAGAGCSDNGQQDLAVHIDNPEGLLTVTTARNVRVVTWWDSDTRYTISWCDDCSFVPVESVPPVTTYADGRTEQQLGHVLIESCNQTCIQKELES